MMRVLLSDQGHFPDPAAWDRLVAGDPRGHLLQTWAWGELKGAFGWRPLRLALEQDGAPVAGAQVLCRRAGPVCLAYIPKGPVLLEETAEVREALWRALHRAARRRLAIALKLEPDWRDEEAERRDWLTSAGFAPSARGIQPRRTISVDMQGSPEELLARMKNKWRYNIRLAERKGVEVRVGDTEDLATFHALLRVTGERDAFGVHSLAYYRRAWELFAPAERARLYLASYQGEVLAGLMVYVFNGVGYYLYGASSNTHRELMPNHLLQWQAMLWARSAGCRAYDLWGIADDEPDAAEASGAALAGVQRFKEGFGGQVVRYVGAYDYVYSRPLYALMQRLWGTR